MDIYEKKLFLLLTSADFHFFAFTFKMDSNEHSTANCKYYSQFFFNALEITRLALRS